jgi:hypothetical protein
MERLWRWQTGLLILALFWLAAIGYWLSSGFLDPAGTMLFLFTGGAMGFGFAVLFQGSRGL